MNVKILYLYKNLLNLYGNVGNIMCLKRHLEENGIEVSINAKESIKDVNLNNFDVIYMGAGTERSCNFAMLDLIAKKDEILNFSDSGKIILALGNSFEMLGESITDINNKTYEGIALFSFTTEEIERRVVEDTVCSFNQIESKIIGFMNKQSKTLGCMNPLFNVISGAGNSKGDSGEGALYKNTFGTNLAGPILVRNPHFREYIENKIYELIGADKKAVSFENELKAYQNSLNGLLTR